MSLTREQILAEMGVTPIWRQRAAAPTGLPGEPAAAAPVTGSSDTPLEANALPARKGSSASRLTRATVALSWRRINARPES